MFVCLSCCFKVVWQNTEFIDCVKVLNNDTVQISIGLFMIPVVRTTGPLFTAPNLKFENAPKNPVI